MALNIPNGFAEASFIYTSNEGTPPFVTTLGVDLRLSAEPDYVDVANTLFALYADSIMSITDKDLLLERCSLFIGASGPSGSIDSTVPARAGGRASEGLPWALSAIARKNTDRLGRSGKGRMFLPGVVSPTEINQAGQISQARRTIINTELVDFYESLVDTVPSGYPPVLFHNEGSSDDVPTPILNFTVAPLAGWIRGRIR